MNVKCIFTDKNINIKDVIKETFTLYVKNDFSKNVLKSKQDCDIIKSDEQSPVGGVA